ncbi:hypothetical protein DPMN_177589 [Dreissena polymorpha]|uniref:Uncharacterized protein n=1 Tax=Dreissena polymorpha TaxID=45954 RepID=A0A9D4EBA4_DREPO|nr:hypothetical protein DPMN_177589 [Dreissena polymorpha]
MEVYIFAVERTPRRGSRCACLSVLSRCLICDERTLPAPEALHAGSVIFELSLPSRSMSVGMSAVSWTLRSIVRLMADFFVALQLANGLL